MTPQQYERLTELFHAVLETAPDQRSAFLDQICVGEPELRRELESLLSAESAALTEKPPEDIAAGLFVQQGGSSGRVASLAPNTRLDHFEIQSLLGQGGMGEVYLAEDVRLHRKVALKILPAVFASNQDRMRRFEQEATTAAALNHPHIAQIFEIGAHNGAHFIAMELVDGVTLRAKIHHEKAELPKLLKYLQQVAEGLIKAHAAGIVHRDLKPDNIMITGDDNAKILDFGLAKLVEPRKPLGTTSNVASRVGGAARGHSSAGMVMGTAGYMSPEQAQGAKEIDQRSDIFSFGCILFEVVTGQRPFADDSLGKSLHKVVYETASPIENYNPFAPPGLQKVIRRCLAKDREERYQTIKEVALELKEVRQAIAGGVGLDVAAPRLGTSETSSAIVDRSARPTSSAGHIATAIARHQRVAAIILVALVAAVGYGLYRFVSSKTPAANSPANKMTRLTFTGKVSTGSIAPDGKRLVYVVENAGQQSIWARQVANSSSLQIVAPSEATYSNLRFTHDGNYIYFTGREKDGLQSLYQMSVLGGMQRRIVEDFSTRAVLSPDDKRIAFIRGGFFENENSLVVANSDGSGEQVLATRKSPLNFYFGGIAWTPDGKSITCVTGPHAQKLVKVPLDGGTEKLIETPNWFSVINIEWLPDGTGLIVAALESRTSPLQVWHLSYPSGAARRITNDFSNYTNLSLAADANTLIVTKREATSHIWLVPEGDANQAKQLTTGTFRQDGNPSVNWTADGRIIFDSTVSGSVHTWIMNGDGSDQRQLTDGAYDDQGAHVSHDGRYIVFTSNRTGAQHIYRMDIDGNNLKQLTDGADEAAPFFSPDDKWVICSSNNYSSWKVAADGGELVQLTNDSFASSMSPDGKLVVHVRPVEAGSRRLWKIAIIPFEGGPPLKTFQVRSDSRPNSRWTLDGRSIIYNLTQGGVLSGVTNLWLQPLDLSLPKQLTHFTSETFFSFDWSRDGKSLVCGRGAISSDVVLISNFR